MAHVIILDGQVVGGWKHTLEKKTVRVELNLSTKLLRSETEAIKIVVENFGEFLKLPVKIITQESNL